VIEARVAVPDVRVDRPTAEEGATAAALAISWEPERAAVGEDGGLSERGVGMTVDTGAGGGVLDVGEDVVGGGEGTLVAGTETVVLGSATVVLGTETVRIGTDAVTLGTDTVMPGTEIPSSEARAPAGVAAAVAGWELSSRAAPTPARAAATAIVAAPIRRAEDLTAGERRAFKRGPCRAGRWCSQG
jgi:hypothetical protein